MGNDFNDSNRYQNGNANNGYPSGNNRDRYPNGNINNNDSGNHGDIGFNVGNGGGYSDAVVRAAGKSAYSTGMAAGFVMGIAVMLLVVLGSNILLKKVYQQREMKGVITDLDEVSDKISLIEGYLNRYYFEDVDEEQLVNGIYYGMTLSLGDPYTSYYTPEEYEDMTSSTMGEYCGIGVRVTTNENNEVVVSQVFKKSPAREAGVQVGDVFYSVEGKRTEEMTMEELVELVLGEEGSDVHFEVLRDGEVIAFTVTRMMVEEDTVEFEMKEDNIGYVKIGEFDAVTPDQVREAIKDLSAQDMKGIVLDLRDNPGGSLTSVQAITSMFKDGKELFLYSETKEGKRENYYTTGNVLLPDLPMVILINGDSASASEAFTGAMKCYERAVIVGTTSFGKGIMQTIYPLDDGSALKITTGKYYLPDGSNIHKIGIEPDYVVEASNVEGEDTQLEKALELLR